MCLPGTAVSARAGSGGSVALFMPTPTPNVCRLRPSAAISARLDQRLVLQFQHCAGGVREEGQRPETAGAKQNSGWIAAWIILKKKQDSNHKERNTSAHLRYCS